MFRNACRGPDLTGQAVVDGRVVQGCAGAQVFVEDISPDGKWVASTGVKQPGPTVLLPTGAGQPLTLADGQLFTRRG